mmetsp:Transcript_12230/g.27151  ORF Transcript_12230/g.27151 Transcript_12230/m.27151 type:complete len:118 (+) Transcript_12230:5-358(+)
MPELIWYLMSSSRRPTAGSGDLRKRLQGIRFEISMCLVIHVFVLIPYALTLRIVQVIMLIVALLVYLSASCLSEHIIPNLVNLDEMAVTTLEECIDQRPSSAHCTAPLELKSAAAQT